MSDDQLGHIDPVNRMKLAEMMNRRQLLLRSAAAGMGASAVAASLSAGGFKASAQDAATNLVTVADEAETTWIRNFNPLAPGDPARWPTINGVHEPLMVYNKMTGELVPWLADSYEYTPDNLQLTIAIHPGVLWSDATPFTARDVAYTFNLLKENTALSGSGAIRNVLNLMTTIEATDDATVSMTFSEVYSPGLYDIMGQNIVPEHIWSTVEDPVTFTNETPVGTGPVTEVTIFEGNYWEIHRNPNYWQEGKPEFEGFRFPLYPDNDAAQRALVEGEVDWGSKFIPDIETVYVAEDPENRGFWFPPTGDTIHLYLLTTVAPFDDVNVRKAISMALNREDICSFAMYDYTNPSDSTGLSGAYENWKDPQYTDAEWVSRNVEMANQMLDEAGYAMDGDVRTGPDGQPLEFDLLVVNGFTDWVQTCQIMAENLSEIGITANLTPLEQSVWFDRLQRGDFRMAICWSSGGATPFNYYRHIMSSQTFNEVGEISGENWHRFVSPEADEILTQFASTTDAAEQQRLASELQRIFSEQAPAVPIFPGPQWYQYNSTRFEGWPTEENPYAVPSNYAVESLITMMTIRPVGAAE